MASSASELWARHDAQWRDPAQVVSQWEEAGAADPHLLRFSAGRRWWGLLDELQISVLVTREYEHLLMALSTREGEPHISFIRLPHPSGLAVERRRGAVYVASTRNPNQLFELSPTRTPDGGRALMPRRSWFYPGSLYLHDLAFVGSELHANAVGQNAVVRLRDGVAERVWWPRSIETPTGPDFDRNYLQLNSIAAGRDLRSSFFTASAATVSARRPGHRNFPVDRRGVVFSGKTREPVAHGLTRPHSARLRQGRVWVDNSGYGELGVIEDGSFTAVSRLPGWTRGLSFRGRYAFVGTSRVIPRFRQYAPGLDVERSVCGVHAVDLHTGEVAAALTWPSGNQVFAVECVPASRAAALPFEAGARGRAGRAEEMFYGFSTDRTGACA